MALEKKLLIVIDPTLDTQPAVDRVINLVELGSTDYKPEVVLLVTADINSPRIGPAGLSIDGQLIDQAVEGLRNVGIAPEVRFSWSREWAETILATAEETGATSLMLSHPGAESAQAMTDDFWQLIRNTSVPVGIIQQSDKPRCETILASINIQDQSEERRALNRKIGEAGKALARTYNAQLHLANAYGGSTDYPDRGRLVSETGLPNEQIHLVSGEPEEGIAEITRELDPDVIIIGATHRRGIKAALRGRKMSRIFRAVNKDIVVVV